jgi:hypothetical protein
VPGWRSTFEPSSNFAGALASFEGTRRTAVRLEIREEGSTQYGGVRKAAGTSLHRGLHCCALPRRATG